MTVPVDGHGLGIGLGKDECVLVRAPDYHLHRIGGELGSGKIELPFTCKRVIRDREVPVTMQTAISSCNVRFNILSSLQGEDPIRRAHRYRPARAARIAGKHANGHVVWPQSALWKPRFNGGCR